MQSQHDWAQIEDEDDEDETYSQESDHHEEQRPQPQEQLQEPQNQSTGPSVQYESRPSGHRGGGEGRGNRGDRRQRGGRENRGDRNNRRENREGPRQGDKPKQPMESQPKQEMLNLIKRQRDTTTMITVFNVAFNSTAADVKALYPEVKFRSDREPKPGVFVFELDQDEALKFTEIGGKILNGREFFIKLSYENQANNPEQYHAGGRPDKYRFDDKPRRGGGGGPGGERRNNNRREYNQEHDNNSYNKPRGQNFNKDRPQDYGNKRPQQYNRDRGDDHHHDFRRAEPAKIDTDNKFFRNHDLQASEFNIRFVKSVSVPAKENSANQSHEHHEDLPKPIELTQDQSTGPKVAKPNPFGDAKPRDENEYLKKKEEEKKVEVEKKNPFEGKREQPPKFEPKIITKPQTVVENKPVETKPEEPAPTTQKPEYEKKQERRQDNRPYREKRDNYYEKKGGNYGGNRGGERKYNKDPVDEEALNDYADDDYENGDDEYNNYANIYKQYQKSHKYERYDDEQGGEGYLETEEKYAQKPPRQDKNPLQISHYRSEGGHQKPRGYGRGGRGGGNGGGRGGRGGGNKRGGGYSQVVYEEKTQDSRPQYTKKDSYTEAKNENKVTTPQNQSQSQTQIQKGKGRTMDKFNVFDHFDIKKD